MLRQVGTRQLEKKVQAVCRAIANEQSADELSFDLLEFCLTRSLTEESMEMIVQATCDRLQSSNEVDILAVLMTLISELCYESEPYRKVVRKCPIFVPCCLRIFSAFEDALEACLFAIRNVTWQLGESSAECEFVAPLVTPCVQLMERMLKSPELTALCATVSCALFNMSLISSLRKQMVEEKLETSLLRLIQSQDVDLGADGRVSLSTTLANIAIETTNDAVWGVLERQGILDELLACLEATLNGEDYPTGTGLNWDTWELLAPLSRLTTQAKFCVILSQDHVMSMVTRALTIHALKPNMRAAADNRNDALLVKYALEFLWNVTAFLETEQTV